jgi:hypothetical protein
MTMNNLAALTLLPQEQLNLAYSNETAELNRYRWLALAFLPFDSSVSRLMTAISTECVHRLCSLQEVASKMELGACIHSDQSGEGSLLAANSRHFFVVDDGMGRQLLARAEEAAQMSCKFFGWLLETNATPELHSTLFNFVTQKNNEYHVLQECREQWKLGFSALSLAG